MANQKKNKGNKRLPQFLRPYLKCWQLYVFMLPAVLYILIFAYKPMYGVLAAFQNFSIRKGVMGSEWVGFDNFSRLFESYWFPIIFKNTLTISFLSLILGFPMPIILALLFNEAKSAKFRSLVQTVSYAPYFISVVVLCGMLSLFLSPTNGIINKVIEALGFSSIAFLQEPKIFKWVYVFSDMWQGMGWGSIIYYAALSSIDKALLEAADIDGATRLQKIWHIYLSEIRPTIVIMLILKCGSLLSIGYEKAFLLQTDTNLMGSEIISTFVYKMGLVNNDFAFSTAMGLVNTVINCILLVTTNKISKIVTDSGLF